MHYACRPYQQRAALLKHFRLCLRNYCEQPRKPQQQKLNHHQQQLRDAVWHSCRRLSACSFSTTSASSFQPSPAAASVSAGAAAREGVAEAERASLSSAAAAAERPVAAGAGASPAASAAAEAAAAAATSAAAKTAAAEEDEGREARRPFYFDYQATTPVDPRVLDAMMVYNIDCFGNPHSSSHAAGWEAKREVEKARESVAAVLGLPPSRSREIVFTSGATESNNLATKGLVRFYEQQQAHKQHLLQQQGKQEPGKPRKSHIITTQIEHKCVLQCCRLLHLEWQQSGGASGAEVTFLPVSADGLVSAAAVAAAIRPETLLVSVIHVNNEIGVVQDLREIGRVCREKGVFFHTDASQGFGKVPLNVDEMNIDLLSVSGHKIYGPKGVGALFVRARRPKVRLAPIIDGGGQERGMRSGTLPTPLIVGLGKAASLALECMDSDRRHVERMARLLLHRLQQQLPHITVNGSLNRRYLGNLNISFSFVEGESLLMSIGDVAMSSGSACTSESLEPSYVLRSLGVGEETAHTSIRIGLGRFTREEEVRHCADRLVAEVRRLREMSPLYDAAMEAMSGKTDDSPKLVWT
ncbi:cysteine desulfurase, putative [Eimeria tenella]|uniref:cysteine desulfurase n=1 Tax=Eimeria tenella TaxID=5802 RepID=U6KLS1_EIMTE|nr:cysteine desulfurase, putative [Eimeria tenella]CDJ37242.1 cysteine desulfurase, putative [Eimeria tenella]|eukprot:XP_013228080.1 cysteine desulfurase, putative [Eimeria tenella]